MTDWHRHSYPLPGPSGEQYLSRAVYADGHDGPCDNPHAVIVLDGRDPETLKPLQRALEAQPGMGVRSLQRAVETLLSERAS